MPASCSIFSENVHPLKRTSVRSYEIDGEAVLYDLSRATVHYLNRTAWLIWGLCDGRTNAARIAEVVAECSGPLGDQRVTMERAISDTGATLMNLANDGLIDLPDEAGGEHPDGST